MGEVFAGRYELVDLIGEGGMGSVWRAWDRRDGEYRAAKVLRQSDSISVMRFIRESSWRIDHPHVLTPRGWVGEDDRVLVSLPIVRGGSLAMVLGDYGTVPWSWLRIIIDQMLNALHTVHLAKVIHRDLKPANILLDVTGRADPHAYLSDFGIAWAEGDPRLTRSSEIVGTRAYQSPAALAGAAPTPADDLYALGVVIAEALTGTNDPERLPAPLRVYVRRLWALEDPLTSAWEARDALSQLNLDVTESIEPVEVFDHMPEFPAGWGPEGPAGASAPLVPAPPPVQPAFDTAPPPVADPGPPPFAEPGPTALEPVEARSSSGRSPWLLVGLLVALGAGLVGVGIYLL